MSMRIQFQRRTIGGKGFPCQPGRQPLNETTLIFIDIKGIFIIELVFINK